MLPLDDAELVRRIPIHRNRFHAAELARRVRDDTRHTVLSTGELIFLATMVWPHYRDHLGDCYTDRADQASCSRAEFYLRLALLSLPSRFRGFHGMKGGSLGDFERLHRVPSSCSALGK